MLVCTIVHHMGLADQKRPAGSSQTTCQPSALAARSAGVEKQTEAYDRLAVTALCRAQQINSLKLW